MTEKTQSAINQSWRFIESFSATFHEQHDWSLVSHSAHGVWKVTKRTGDDVWFYCIIKKTTSLWLHNFYLFQTFNWTSKVCRLILRPNLRLDPIKVRSNSSVNSWRWSSTFESSVRCQANNVVNTSSIGMWDLNWAAAESFRSEFRYHNGENLPVALTRVL